MAFKAVESRLFKYEMAKEQFQNETGQFDAKKDDQLRELSITIQKTYNDRKILDDDLETLKKKKEEFKAKESAQPKEGEKKENNEETQAIKDNERDFNKKVKDIANLTDLIKQK